MVLLSICAGLVSGICWLVGDVLLVGFEVDQKRYSQFTKGSLIGNKELAMLMLSASKKRLRWGALLANFSIPLMLAGLYSLFMLAHLSRWNWLAIVFLGIGFVLSPVAHVAFYYVGIISKVAYEQSEGKSCSVSNAKLINEVVLFLDITWRVAVGVTALGWLVYSFLIFTNQTILPSYLGILTPLFGSLWVILLVKKLKLGRPYLNGAAFNVAFTIFFILVLWYYLYPF